MGLRISKKGTSGRQRMQHREKLLSFAAVAYPLGLLALSWSSLATLGFWTNALMVAAGLGFVIFIHELGHFLVAKACGVKCEKFYVGFDIFGLKLISKRWGETEYGIGLLPLGGYVKMLGQDDNPSKIYEEMQKAKRAQQATASAEGNAPHPQAAPVSQLDPRSYLAKSVPQRMAIISAGVIMNLLSGWAMAAIAYSLGVEYTPCVVGRLDPGAPAWEKGLRPGDKIIRVNDIEQPRFERDLRHMVAYGDPVRLRIARPRLGSDQFEEFDVEVTGRTIDGGDFPIIGMSPGFEPILNPIRPVRPHTPAAKAQPAFQGGDRIVGVNEHVVKTFADLDRAMAGLVDEAVTITVERLDSKTGQPQRVKISVDPAPRPYLGLVMEWGPIQGVQEGSPAQQAGMAVGDTIVQIDGAPAGNPLTLADRMRRAAGKQVTFTVLRGGKQLTLSPLTPRTPEVFEAPQHSAGFASAPAIGIAYGVLNKIAAVEKGSPADGKFQPGQTITSITFVQPELKEGVEADFPQKEFVLDGQNRPFTWAGAELAILPRMLPGTKLLITVEGKEQPIELQPEEFRDWKNGSKQPLWFTPVRGLSMQPSVAVRKADGFADAAYLGYRETKEGMGMVFMLMSRIHKLWKQVGGPFTIIEVAAIHAEQGWASLLVFLTLLSANLAVLNFLPIPVLDGGHFMFLVIEGIRKKPLDERAFVIASYLGLFFILGLMVFAISLDISRFLR